MAVSTPSLIDSHCHLTSSRFDEDREEVFARARATGVGELITICSDFSEVEAILDLTEIDGIWGTLGIHPHEAEGGSPDQLLEIGELLERNERLVAVGETGLDFYYDNSPRNRQAELFEAQLDLASRLDLPIVVHSRKADDEMRASISRWDGRVTGVLHCFTGGRALMDTALEAGWYVSFSGIATFKSFDVDLVGAVPEDRILVETDAPYLAPVPFRGSRNEPAFVRYVAERVAQVRSVPMDRFAAQTVANTRRFFSLPDHDADSGD